MNLEARRTKTAGMPNPFSVTPAKPVVFRTHNYTFNPKAQRRRGSPHHPSDDLKIPAVAAMEIGSVFLLAKGFLLPALPA